MPKNVKPAVPLSRRVHNAILSSMDRSGFFPNPLPRLRDPKIWKSTHLTSASTAYRFAGNKMLETVVDNLVSDRLGPSPDRTLICETLVSPATVARLLLQTGDYEDEPPSPFVGMENPLEVGEAWRIYIGAYTASSKNAALNMRVYLISVLTPLAVAAIHSLDSKSRITKPAHPTKRAQVQTERPVRAPKKPRIMTMNEKAAALADLTNKPATPCHSRPSTVSKAKDKHRRVVDRAKSGPGSVRAAINGAFLHDQDYRRYSATDSLSGGSSSVAGSSIVEGEDGVQPSQSSSGSQAREAS
ncbi:hypothetical protein C8R47DRAFT_559811 [Mycena vitilis]|nr:hypothetical protein C8R47DRAFT_559811 [Mycena vitilis]